VLSQRSKNILVGYFVVILTIATTSVWSNPGALSEKIPSIILAFFSVVIFMVAAYFLLWKKEAQKTETIPEE
jgi:hypothetical protein